MATNPFTDKLPSELRIKIYELTLASSYPVKRQQHDFIPDEDNVVMRQPAQGHENALPGLSVLRLNKLAYREALPALYKVNTFRVRRTEFCKSTPTMFASFTKLDLRHLAHVELSDLQAGAYCGLKANHTHCDNCKDPLFGLLYHLAALPRLETVMIDYSGETVVDRRTESSNSGATYLTFKQALKHANNVHHGFTIAFAGLGQYRLEGDRLGSVRVTFTNSRLIYAWENIIEKPFWGQVGTAVGRKAGKEIYDKICLLSVSLAGFGGSTPMVPQSMAHVWPLNTIIDYRAVTSMQDHDLLKKLDKALREYVYEHDSLWVLIDPAGYVLQA